MKLSSRRRARLLGYTCEASSYTLALIWANNGTCMHGCRHIGMSASVYVFVYVCMCDRTHVPKCQQILSDRCTCKMLVYMGVQHVHVHIHVCAWQWIMLFCPNAMWRTVGPTLVATEAHKRPVLRPTPLNDRGSTMKWCHTLCLTNSADRFGHTRKPYTQTNGPNAGLQYFTSKR